MYLWGKVEDANNFYHRLNQDIGLFWWPPSSPFSCYLQQLIVIPSLETLRGSLPPARKRKVIDWARENMNFIVGKWNEFNQENRLWKDWEEYPEYSKLIKWGDLKKKIIFG